MTSRVRGLLLGGLVLVCIAGFISVGLSHWHQGSVSTTQRPTGVRLTHIQAPKPPPFNDPQFNQFLVDARKAETIADPLQRCLGYPNPPGLDWSAAVTSAYCRYQFDPAVTRAEVRRLIESGHAQELDKRLAHALHAQLTKPDAQALLDRTFVINFKDGSEEMRALMDAWKRQSPMSPFALAASGTAYVEMAQQVRGTEYASKTSQNSFESMGRLLERARTDLDKAVELDPHITSAYGAMVYAGTLQSDGAYAVNAAKRGLGVDPANYTIYARLV